MDLTQLRTEIDEIDDQLVALFLRRMQACALVADYKKAHNLPILMPSREQKKLRSVAEKAGPELAEDMQKLYTLIMELSRNYQSRHIEVI